MPPSSSPRPRRRSRERTTTERHLLDSAEDLGLATTLSLATFGSVLAVGGVHLPVLLGVWAVVLVGLLLALRVRARLPVAWPALFLVGLAAYTALQATLLPFRWLSAIAPHNAEVWARSLTLLEGAPAYATLSLDPGATWVEALRYLVYAGVVLIAATLAARRGALFGVALVFVSALTLALATLGHGLAGATRVWGIYQPSFHVQMWHVGPLLNPNNLAGYLNMGALAGIGILLSREPPVPRWAIGLGIASIVGVEMLSASRSGVAVLPLGFLLLAGIVRAQGRRLRMTTSRRTPWVIGGALLAGGIFAWTAGSSSVWDELYDKNLDKLEMFTWTRPLLADHGLLGAGRGAFESVFMAYAPKSSLQVFTHAESFPVQWASEWGIPVAVITLAALGWLLKPRDLGVLNSPIAAGAWVAVVILVLQNLIDLALEIPGVCIAMAVLVGSLWGEARARSTPRRRRVSSTRSRRVGLAAALASVGVAAASVALGRHAVAADRATARAAYEHLPRPPALESPPEAAPEAVTALRSDLGAMIRRHPADPYFPLLYGALAWDFHDQNPLAWLQRSLERAKQNGRAHLLIAQVVAARGGMSQAMLELRLATEQQPGLSRVAAGMALGWSRRFEDLIRAAPSGREGIPTLDAMATRLSGADSLALRQRIDWEILARDVGDPPAHQRLAQDLLNGLRRGPAGRACADRQACERGVREHAEHLAAREPSSSRAVRLRADLLTLEGKTDEASRLLDQACPTASDRSACYAARLELLARFGDEASVSTAIRELIAASCTSRMACANAWTTAARAEEQRGNLGKALTAYRHAAEEDPHELRWLELARIAERSGASYEAVIALEKIIEKRAKPDTTLQRRLDAARSLSAKSLIVP